MKVTTLKENEDGSVDAHISYTKEELGVIIEAGTIGLMSAYLCEMTVPEFMAKSMEVHRKIWGDQTDGQSTTDQNDSED